MISIRQFVLFSVVMIPCLGAFADSTYDFERLDRPEKLSRIVKEEKHPLFTQQIRKEASAIAPILIYGNEPNYNLALARTRSSPMDDPAVVPEASAFVLTGSGIFCIWLFIFVQSSRRLKGSGRESCLPAIGQ